LIQPWFSCLWFVVGGRRRWRECADIRTRYILHTFFFCTSATISLFRAKPTVHFALLLKKKRNSRGIFQKKSSREILKRCSRQSLIPTEKYRYRLYLIPGNTDTEKMTGTNMVYNSRIMQSWEANQSSGVVCRR
jgi:hypothetical protein